MKHFKAQKEFSLREKLLTYGPHCLSDLELLAIFIGSGNKQKSCLDLAFELLKKFANIRAILNSDYEEFNQISGLGAVRYTQLQAIQELCRRSEFINLKQNAQLTHSRETFSFLKAQLRDKKNEAFIVIYLDSQNRIIAAEELSQGTIDTAAIYFRPLMGRILQLNAAAIIVAHNHPSGIAAPSPEDLQLTEGLQSALRLIDVRLLDHLIIADNDFYSILGANAQSPEPLAHTH